jgi:hypothetical protein
MECLNEHQDKANATTSLAITCENNTCQIHMPHATLNAARASTIFTAYRTTVLEHCSHSALVRLARDGVKRPLFWWMFGVWTQKVCNHISLMPPQSKGNTLPLLDYALAFNLQLGKLTENCNNSRQSKLQSNCCVNLAALLAAASDASLSL